MRWRKAAVLRRYAIGRGWTRDLAREAWAGAYDPRSEEERQREQQKIVDNLRRLSTEGDEVLFDLFATMICQEAERQAWAAEYDPLA